MISRWLVAEVIEVILIILRENGSPVRVRPTELARLVELSSGTDYNVAVEKIAAIVRRAFPVHKNRRRHVKRFKVRLNEAVEFLRIEKIILRPIEEAAESPWIKGCVELTRIGKMRGNQ